MSRRKKASEAYNKAVKRTAALKSIDPNLDFGNGLNVTIYDQANTDLKALMDNYNTKLSDLDAMLNDITTKELVVADLSERMLAAVAGKYGKDSNEYEQAGGVRKSERRKPVRNKKAA